ncbi:MAG: hypothetical protein WC465_04060 [Patescibacteria group bacterium]
MLYTQPPLGWLVIDHRLGREDIGRSCRLQPDDVRGELHVVQMIQKGGVEVRSYFKGLIIGRLNVQAQAIHTILPGGCVQEFHGHNGTCLEITCVIEGALLAVEHETLTVEQVRQMLSRFCSSDRDALLGNSSILLPGSLHIADPSARHTLASLEDSSFWTWQLPVPDDKAPPFKSERIPM